MLGVASALVGFIFLTSGAGKLASRQAVNKFVQGLGLPRRLAGTVSASLGLTELLVGLLLIVGIQPRWITICAAALSGGFLAAHAWSRLRGQTAGCRCFGAIDTELSPAISAARSAALLAIAVAAAIAVQEPSHQLSVLGISPVALLSGIFGTVSYILIFHLINEARILVRRDREIHQSLLEAASRLSRS